MAIKGYMLGYSQTEKIRDEQSQTVYMSNILIQQTDYRLTLTEIKIILYIISKIGVYDKPDKEYLFSVKDFCQVCNTSIDGGAMYAYIRDLLKQLRKKDIVIHPTKDTELITGWFAEVELNKKTNEFTISFANKVKPYLFALTSNFTRMMLECILPMKSIYGVLLFMYLSSVNYKGARHTLDLEELRHRMGCDGKYEQSSDIRKYIIEPALKDINTYTDMNAEYKFIKEGRKVVQVEFEIHPAGDDFAKRLIARQKALGQR